LCYTCLDINELSKIEPSTNSEQNLVSIDSSLSRKPSFKKIIFNLHQLLGRNSHLSSYSVLNIRNQKPKCLEGTISKTIAGFKCLSISNANKLSDSSDLIYPNNIQPKLAKINKRSMIIGHKAVILKRKELLSKEKSCDSIVMKLKKCYKLRVNKVDELNKCKQPQSEYRKVFTHCKSKSILEDNISRKDNFIKKSIINDGGEGGKSRLMVCKIERLFPIKTSNRQEISPKYASKRSTGFTLTPLNLLEQEQLFFQSECTINPTLFYNNQKNAKRILKLFQKPKGDLLPLAIQTIESYLKQYHSEEEFLNRFGGKLLSIEETKDAFMSYIRELGLEDQIILKFSDTTVSPTTIAHNITGKSIITIGLPIQYRQNQIKDVLNHEIGTHFLRKYNDNFQVWREERKKYGLKNCIVTEEGLATLNQLYELVGIYNS